MRSQKASTIASRFRTGDMRQRLFADEAFDGVLSNVALHDIKRRAGRNQAIDEAVRVLRPGGRLLIADLRGTRRYCERLN